MRFLAAALVALSLTACLGSPGEPLGSFDERVNEARVGGDIAAPQLTLSSTSQLTARTVFEGQPVEEAPPEVVNDPLIAEVAATIDYASAQAFAAADAGNFRDRDAAQLAAIELATAAAIVQQRANEFHALSSTGSAGEGPCGEEPVEGVEGGELPTPVDEAVTVSALAAELGAEIADTLDPPSTMDCSGPCGSPCTEVPGTVDEEVLALAVESVLDAAQDCADLGIELGAPNVL